MSFLSGDMETDSLFETAVLWRYEGAVSPSGRRYTDAEPVEIPCRWENGYEEYHEETASVVRYAARVFVACDIPTGSWLWYGCLDDFVGTGSGKPTTEIVQVDECVRTPDILGMNFERYCKCMRFGDDLPSPDDPDE